MHIPQVMAFLVDLILRLECIQIDTPTGLGVKDTSASALSIIQVMLVRSYTSMTWCHTFFNDNQTKVERHKLNCVIECHRMSSVDFRPWDRNVQSLLTVKSEATVLVV